jgi:DNA primase small subunit
MKSYTRNFMITKFREYYQDNSLMVPPSLDSREWAFLPFGDEKGMRRHRSFLSENELMVYIRNIVPAHIYHSAAYYQRPSAPIMKEKIWMGADLIFDLDADHLREKPESYNKMLSLVKKETKKLITFLTSDFGFDEKSINLVFSGGRGYHIHVRHPNILNLESNERREVVDYITGRGLDIWNFIEKAHLKGDCGSKSAYSLRARPEGSPGWGDRINSSLKSLVCDYRMLGEEDAIKRLRQTKGIGEKGAMRFYKAIKKNENLIEDIRQGNLDSFKGSDEIWSKLIEEYVNQSGVELGKSIDMVKGETDEPVTSDVKRLIRCPGSLHGGSGLKVTPLSVQELEEFEPLRDAVVFGEDPIPIEITKPFTVELRGQNYRVFPGLTEVPLHAAIFLMARGAAELSAT